MGCHFTPRRMAKNEKMKQYASAGETVEQTGALLKRRMTQLLRKKGWQFPSELNIHLP